MRGVYEGVTKGVKGVALIGDAADLAQKPSVEPPADRVPWSVGPPDDIGEEGHTAPALRLVDELDEAAVNDFLAQGKNPAGVGVFQPLGRPLVGDPQIPPAVAFEDVIE